MSASFSVSESTTFTIVHARHIAAKVAADLKRMQRFYHSPADTDIARFEGEVIDLVKAGYLKSVSYGFRRDGNWIAPSVHYDAKDLLASGGANDDPGGIAPGADISGATFYSFMTYSAAWSDLSQAARDAFESTLPVQRTTAPAPGLNGYLAPDLTYSAGGKALARSTLRSF